MKLPIALALAAFTASVTLAPIASAFSSNPNTPKCGGEEKKDEKKDEKKGDDKS